MQLPLEWKRSSGIWKNGCSSIRLNSEKQNSYEFRSKFNNSNHASSLQLRNCVERISINASYWSLVNIYFLKDCHEIFEITQLCCMTFWWSDMHVYLILLLFCINTRLPSSLTTCATGSRHCIFVNRWTRKPHMEKLSRVNASLKLFFKWQCGSPNSQQSYLLLIAIFLRFVLNISQ